MSLKRTLIVLLIFTIASCGSNSSNNTPPELIGITSFSIFENTTEVTTITALDAQDDPISYYVSGIDSGLLTIGESTGILVFNNAPDFENPQDSNNDNIYEIEIRASDETSSSDLGILVSVNNVDENPLAAITVDKETASTYSIVILTWECERSLSAEAEGDWTGTKSLLDSENIYLSTSGSKTFTIKCINEEGSTSASAGVDVGNIILKNVPINVSLFKDG
tara:strand:+ start:259 stop:924 length:666 start_codon:yes stop_codon:yes gene_type:complete